MKSLPEQTKPFLIFPLFGTLLETSFETKDPQRVSPWNKA